MRFRFGLRWETGESVNVFNKVIRGRFRPQEMRTMAIRAPASPALPVRRFEMRDFWRVALWGLSAAGAVLLAIFVSASDRGNDRLIAAATHLRLMPAKQVPAPVAEPPRAAENTETKQLAEAVKSLAADRDRLLARLNTLERSLDVTSAVPRTQETPQALQPIPPAPPPQATPPESVSVQTVLPRPSPQAQTSAPQTQAAATPEPAETAAPVPATPSRAQFGVDLGSSATVEGLRVLWTNAKSKYGSALEGLRPVMLVRDHARPGGVELRLIAGPVANAAAAARLCNAMIGSVCQPAVYEGQRLALR